MTIAREAEQMSHTHPWTNAPKIPNVFGLYGAYGLKGIPDPSKSI